MNLSFLVEKLVSDSNLDAFVLDNYSGGGIISTTAENMKTSLLISICMYNGYNKLDNRRKVTMI